MGKQGCIWHRLHSAMVQCCSKRSQVALKYYETGKLPVHIWTVRCLKCRSVLIWVGHWYAALYVNKNACQRKTSLCASHTCSRTLKENSSKYNNKSIRSMRSLMLKKESSEHYYIVTKLSQFTVHTNDLWFIHELNYQQQQQHKETTKMCFYTLDPQSYCIIALFLDS